jgi:hypothetical protein
MTGYRIDENAQLVVLSFAGEVGYGDLVACINECRSDPRYSPSFRGVADLRNVTLNLTRQEVIDLAGYVVGNEMTSGTWALLADNPQNTALSFLYMSVASQQYPIRVFSSVEAASDFLGCPLHDLLP